MLELPEYTDGKFKLFRIKNDESNDFPRKILKNEKMEIWFRELSVFDRTRYEFESSGKEVTMKVRIPRYKKIDSECVVEIEGEKHLVFNAAHVIDKNGFKETELTLTKMEEEIEEDEKNGIK